MPDRPMGFVSMKSLQAGTPAAGEALDTIRRIYFKTTARTIEADFAHAIELLKSLADEAAREKASVYMEGLAELRKEWQRSPAGRPAAPRAKKKTARRPTPR